MPAASQPFQAPSGTSDVLAPESGRWQALLERFAGLAERAGYGFALLPAFEDLGVFVRGIGESTDIVTHEMYDFDDKGGRRLALRPELTASMVRAFIQHRPVLPWKAWCWGPVFRYERPQAGRYRQFHQLDVEVLGTEDPELDVEVIALAWRFYEALGLTRLRLDVNSLGDGECRPAYRSALVAWLEPRAGELCPEHQDRWRLNPLRVLDCKREACREVTGGAPRQLDHLCVACAAHWEAVLGGLDALGIGCRVQPRLVRGIDYYTRTTFEVAAEALGSAQDAVGGGGRYDGLVEALGGPPTAGIGFALGVERVLLACDAEGAFPAPGPAVVAFVVDLTGGRAALELTHELRAAGVAADRAFDSRSIRAQLKAADRSGADIALIVGPDEAENGTVTLRRLRGHDGSGGAGDDQVQETVGRREVVARVAEALRARPPTAQAAP
ncbi:MAG: histidine--tRNA ligase [Acidimicrobiales bacterium]